MCHYIFSEKKAYSYTFLYQIDLLWRDNIGFVTKKRDKLEMVMVIRSDWQFNIFNYFCEGGQQT